MTIKMIFFKGAASINIHEKVWMPDGKPTAAIQVIHGMTEHISRYDEFARYFTERGFAVFGHDIESHGLSESSSSDSNSVLYLSSWANAVEDIKRCRDKFLKSVQDPEIPIIMVGFSLGSFLLRDFTIRYPEITGLKFFIGTGNPKTSELRFAKALIQMFCRDKNKPSKLVRTLAFTSYNAKVKHPETECDWLIRDKVCRDAYLNDNNVHDQMSPAFFLAFLDGMITLKTGEQGHRNNPGKAVFISGTEDPVGGTNAEGAKQICEIYRNLGFDTAFVPYIEYRHDILHDYCRADVFEDIFQISKDYL